MIGRDVVSTTLACAVLIAVFVPMMLVVSERIGVLTPVIVGLFLRTVIGLGNQILFGPTSDAGGYDDLAVSMANSERVLIPDNKKGWPILLGWIYRFIGHAPEVGVVINVLAGVATVLLVAAIPLRLGWRPAVLPAAWIMAIWPISVLWGPLLLREATVTFLIAVALLAAVMVRTRRIILGVFLLVTSGILMLFMRGGLATMILAVLPAVILLTIAFPGGGAKRMKAFVPTVIVIAIVMPIVMTNVSGVPDMNSDQNQRIATALDGGSTGFTSSGASSGVVMGSLNVAMGPFPWHWGNIGLLMAGIDAMLWVSLYVLAFFGGMHNRINRWGYMLCLIPPIAFIIYMSSFGTNFGLVMRMRTMNVPFLAPIAGLGVAFFIERHRARRAGIPQPSLWDFASLGAHPGHPLEPDMTPPAPTAIRYQAPPPVPSPPATAATAMVPGWNANRPSSVGDTPAAPGTWRHGT